MRTQGCASSSWVAGWGAFAKYAAEKYGAQVLGVTVSKEQAALGMELCQGLPVELRLQDYRLVEGQVRCGDFNRYHGARRPQKLPYLYAGSRPLPEARRDRFCAHDRLQL